MRRAISWVLVGVAIAVSCGERSGSDTFRDGGPRAGRGGEGGDEGNAGEAGAAPVLRGPCLDDTQCNDENACTTDFCDKRYDRCRNEPDDAVCDDGVFCNGAETCDRMLGCRAGPVMSCTDTNTCTIDVCVESSRSCRHEPRDADGDGDPSTSCYGDDCDDLDPLISSSSAERCGNDRDDDCDGTVDEDDCVDPQYDRCGDALSIEQTGAYALKTVGAARNFSLSCAAEEDFRDLAVALIVPEGGPRDVDVVAVTPAASDVRVSPIGPRGCPKGTKKQCCRADVPSTCICTVDCSTDDDCAAAAMAKDSTLNGRYDRCHAGDGGKMCAPDGFCRSTVALAATDLCGNAAAETSCSRGMPGPEGESTARLLLRGLEPGEHAVYVAADRETDVTLEVAFGDPTDAPTNRTCGTAVPLPPGVPARAILAGLSDPPQSRCLGQMEGVASEAWGTGGLFYSLVLEEPRDVRVRAVALDAHGTPVVSLRTAECVAPEDELTCRLANPGELYVRALPAGTYVIAIAGTAPAEVEFVLSIADATEPPPTAGCAAPPILTEGDTKLVDFESQTDAVQIGCLPGAPDVTVEIETPEPSDIMLVQTGSEGDVGAVVVAEAPCELPVDVLACETSDVWPLRTVAHDVPAGGVRAVVQSRGGTPTSFTAFRRPATNTTAVLAADECASAVEIPETGGRFEGNSANLYADYAASCDYGGQSGPGAPDQMLHLVLTERRRVVFDMQGSSYDTMLLLRVDDGCPGTEIEGTCSVGYIDAKSFLDVTLDEGAYNVQIDGYNGANGRWVLEVFTAVP